MANKKCYKIAYMKCINNKCRNYTFTIKKKKMKGK